MFPATLLLPIIKIHASDVINGEVGDELDTAVLEELMTEYANGIQVTTTPYVEGSTEYKTFRLIMMDFLTYGEEHIL